METYKIITKLIGKIDFYTKKSNREFNNGNYLLI
jgi:hypothetical protein